MADYNSQFTGAQIDKGVANAIGLFPAPMMGDMGGSDTYPDVPSSDVSNENKNLLLLLTVSGGSGTGYEYKWVPLADLGITYIPKSNNNNEEE